VNNTGIKKDSIMK